MADETEEPLDERLERMQRRAENFRDLLQDGEEVIIALQDGELHVAESYRSRFERLHPKLFGRMLSIDAQMESGLSPYAVGLLLSGVFIFGVHMQWWEGVLGEALNSALMSWWFYLVLPILALFLTALVCSQREKWVFRRHRKVLADMIAAENLDRDVLIVMIRDQDDIGNVLYQLKLDTEPPRPLAA
ncbi:MAG: hypothetical protein HYX68_22565 [Planctomycetes bacterium]|jgi:hypothetical protein|nr:hypothetical protein [Planctomycetota bacterium]